MMTVKSIYSLIFSKNLSHYGWKPADVRGTMSCCRLFDEHGYTSRKYNELYLHFKSAQTAVLVDVDVLKPDTTYYKNRGHCTLIKY